MNQPIYFIGGIGTEIGKTYVTAQLLHFLAQHHQPATSFKLVQTGATEYPAPDIVIHRHGAPTVADKNGDSCGALYPEPASPHLAAELIGEQVNTADLWAKLQRYAHTHPQHHILCEGAGGIFSPLSREELTIDVVQRHQLPLLLVAHAGLGTIHSTITTLEALAARKHQAKALLFNPYPTEPAAICEDNAEFLRQWLAKRFPSVRFIHLNELQHHPISDIIS